MPDNQKKDGKGNTGSRRPEYPCAQAEESASFPADASTQPPFLIVCTRRKTARVHVFYKVIFMIRAGRPLPLLIFPIVVTQFSCSSRRISRLALRSVIPISSASFAEVISWLCFCRISFSFSYVLLLMRSLCRK